MKDKSEWKTAYGNYYFRFSLSFEKENNADIKKENNSDETTRKIYYAFISCLKINTKLIISKFLFN